MLHRYSPVTKDWDETEYVVDLAFLAANGEVDPTVPVGYVYEPNKGLLDVYLNGQRLSSGGSYLEVDDKSIQLQLGINSDTGEPYKLEVGDELFIKIWKNQYCSRGQATISGTDFHALRQEVYDARTFREGEDSYPTLDSRLDEIQRQLEVIHGGNANVSIEYRYNNRGQIIREIVTGDYKMVREFTYYEDGALSGEMQVETIYYSDGTGGFGNQVTRTYQYDPATRRLLRTTVQGNQ